MKTVLSSVPIWFAADDGACKFKGQCLRVIADGGVCWDRIVKLAVSVGQDGGRKLSVFLEDPSDERERSYLTRDAVDRIQPAGDSARSAPRFVLSLLSMGSWRQGEK